MYDTGSALFWYRAIFMAELLIAEWLFTFKLKKKTLYPLRFALACAACIGLSFAMPVLGYNAFFSSLLFFSLFAVSVVALKFCYNEPWLNVLFCAVAAYTVQHVAFEVYNFIVVITGLNNGLPVEVYGDTVKNLSDVLLGLAYFDSYAVIYWLMFLFFGRIIRKNEDMRILSVSLLLLAALIVFITIVINAMVTYYSYEHNDVFYVCVASVLNVIGCVLALCIQFGILSRKKLRRELEAVSAMWEQEKKQYETVKENIDYINVKCHDLKHQIREIGRSSSLDESSIREMESVISIYDAVLKTGNEALDVILTEKSLFCNKNSIRLTCIAEGDRLAFMSETDIYSLFGNAIDNAIEALSKLDDPEKRVIGIIVKKAGAFLSVHLYNYCPGRLEFANGLPVTTKDDTQSHGFGMKSIRMITEKYGGDLSVFVENDIFNLSILFPLPGNECAENRQTYVDAP